MNECIHPVPPWKQVPELPAGDIGWRMGAGENVMHQWWEWARTTTPTERQNYLLRHCPIPPQWMLWATEVCTWPDDDDDETLDAAWSVLDAASGR
jgi:hypothetical protein